MYHHHKVPTIFNIYMLDVICCALGCVVLLWQVSHQEAETQTAAAKESQLEADRQAAALSNKASGSAPPSGKPAPAAATSGRQATAGKAAIAFSSRPTSHASGANRITSLAAVTLAAAR